MEKMKNIKFYSSILLLLISFILLNTNLCFSRTVRVVNNTSFSVVKHQLEKIGYTKELKDLTNVLKNLFPDLAKLKNIPDKNKRIHKLASLIQEKIKISLTDKFNLIDIFNQTPYESNCLGFTQLVYVLGKAAGLKKIDTILVSVEDVGGEIRGHIANVIHLDRGDVFLDLKSLTQNGSSNAYISSPFNWNENFEKVGGIWELKPNSNIDKLYKIVQLVDKKGIIAAQYVNQGSNKLKTNQNKAAIKYFSKAIDTYPDFAGAYFGKATAQYRLRQADKNFYKKAVENFKTALELNPYLYKNLPFPIQKILTNQLGHLP